MSSPGPFSDMADDGMSLGLFRIGETMIGVDVGILSEVAHIQSLRPSAAKDDTMLGLIPIRGTLLPVVDPLERYTAGNKKPAIVAVLALDGQATGLAVDEVAGLKRFPCGSLQTLGNRGARTLIAGTIYTDDTLIHVLDAPAILSHDALPKAQVDLRKSIATDRGHKTPLLSFEAGGVFLALEAATVVGTVPRQGIEDRTLARGAFLGTMSYFGRRLPILAANPVFGLGRQTLPDRFETVVLRFPDDRLLGLAVEKILHVSYRDAGDQKALPKHVAGATRLIRAGISLSGRDSFVIDVEACLRDDALLAVAHLSDPPKPPEPVTISDARVREETITREAARFILIEAGTRIAISITDIDGMRPPPSASELIPTDRRMPGFAGLFLAEGQPVPLVRLSEYLGCSAAPAAALERVFLTGDKDRRIGFLIDRVTGIAMSEWIARQEPRTDAPDGSPHYDLGAMRAYGSVDIRNILDLRQTARTVAARLADDRDAEPAPCAPVEMPAGPSR